MELVLVKMTSRVGTMFKINFNACQRKYRCAKKLLSTETITIQKILSPFLITTAARIREQ